jgi:hypothetical protein
VLNNQLESIVNRQVQGSTCRSDKRTCTSHKNLIGKLSDLSLVLSDCDFDVCQPVVFGYHKGSKARRVTKNKLSVS